ncbi:response regulator [Agromyces atrinae]|uniref:DNA-binding response OmpR family regulator n=1 Tax=Agromyces atrinae TaxID=592376 RepID=A0A4Q2M1K1_9MICO|nr:response regulator [Agromyces atrinae]MCI2959181.1 response regulator [Agromyces atrinae]NYD65603.1 DNA-binding response OmpR family regulator [Agromyces atrinae]RXZ85007.1 response regulator [Agromyces atrinae]
MSGDRALQVVVVDDSDDQRELLRTQFARAGCDVSTAVDSFEAERLVRAERFDIAVIDLLFPGVDGWAIAERIRELSPTTDIVIASVLDQSDYPKADGVLPKPFTGAEVKRLVSTLATRREGEAS